jgi:hypothetical protein
MSSGAALADGGLDELRRLIIEAAPDPAAAAPVGRCGADEVLDSLIPFSSLIVLGVVVAIEDRYRVKVTRQALAEVAGGGATLRKLARMVDALRRAQDAGR